MNAAFLDLSKQHLREYKSMQYQTASSLDISDNPLQAFGFLAAFKHLLHLTARNANLYELDSIPQGMARQLQSLTVSQNNITSLKSLLYFSSLQKLDISANPILSDQEQCFRNSKQLTTVRFDAGNLNSVKVMKNILFSRFQQVKFDAIRFANMFWMIPALVGGEHCIRIQGNEVAGPIDVETWHVSLFAVQRAATLVTSFRQLKGGVLQLGVLPQGVLYICVVVSFQNATRSYFLGKDGAVRLLEEAEIEVSGQLQPLFSKNSVGNLALSTGTSFAPKSMFSTQQPTYQDPSGQIQQQSRNHYATRVQISRAVQGQWLRITPQNVVKNVVFFQTVLTFLQIAAEMKQILLKDYGIAHKATGELLRDIQDSIRQEKPVLLADGCIRLKIYVQGVTYVGFETQVEQLPVNAGSAEVFLKEPNKLVIANVETVFGRQMLVSDPIEFASEQFNNRAELVKVGSRLLAVYFSADQNEQVKTYTFFRRGTEQFEQSGPGFDLNRLRDMAGKYHVQVRSNKYVVVSEQIQLDGKGNIVQLEPSESSYESSQEEDEADIGNFQPFEPQAPEVVYEGPHHSSTVKLAAELEEQVETLRAQLQSLQQGVQESHQNTMEERLLEDQAKAKWQQEAHDELGDEGLQLREKNPVKIVIKPPRPRQIPMAAEHVKVRRQVNAQRQMAEETFGPGITEEPDVITIEPKVHESPVFTMKKPQKTKIPRDAVAEMNRFKDTKPSFGGRIDPRDTEHFNPSPEKKQDKELERAIREKEKEAGLTKEDKKKQKGMKQPPDYDKNLTSPRTKASPDQLKANKMMVRHKDGLQTDIFATPKDKAPIALDKKDVQAHCDSRGRVPLPTEPKKADPPVKSRNFDLEPVSAAEFPKIRFPRYEAFPPHLERFVEPYEEQSRKSQAESQNKGEDPRMTAWENAVSYKDKDKRKRAAK